MARRTMKGLRADNGNLRQIDAARLLNLNSATYNGIEQFVDDPAVVEAIEKLYGVKIEVTITEANDGQA